MSQPAEFFVSHVIDSLPTTGMEFPQGWPLHMTVVPPFLLGDYATEQEILEVIHRTGQEVGPLKLEYGVINPGAIPLVPGEWDSFGDNNDIDVVRIEDPSGKLLDLHKLLIQNIGGAGCQFLRLDPQWSGDNYHPHATTKSGSVLDRPFFCTTLSMHKKYDGVKSVAGTVDMYATPFGNG